MSSSTNCFAVWAVTSILYWLSWTMKSIWLPRTPPAALISLTASFAPFAAGRSSADSSPVSAKPPPILMVPPVPVLAPALAPELGAELAPVLGAELAPVLGAAALEPGGVVAAGELQAAARPMTVASANPRATVLRILSPPDPHGRCRERTGAA